MQKPNPHPLPLPPPPSAMLSSLFLIPEGVKLFSAKPTSQPGGGEENQWLQKDSNLIDFKVSHFTDNSANTIQDW